MPPSELPPILQRFDDKLLHFAEFFLLFLASVNAFRLARSSFFRHSAILAAGYGILAGILTEILQHSVEGRSPETADLAADGLGTLAGLILYAFLRYLAYTRSHHALRSRELSQ